MPVISSELMRTNSFKPSIKKPSTTTEGDNYEDVIKLEEEEVAEDNGLP